MISEAQLVLTGIGIGLLVAAPVGPVNILSIQVVLERGFLAGVAAGLGAVVADGLLALLAASGVTAISGMMTRHHYAIQLIGGLILLLFGVRLFLSSPHGEEPQPRRTREADAWLVPKTFFLTLTNPGAVLGMFALVGSVTSAIGGINGFAEVGLLVAGIMAGGLVWWVGLAAIIARIAHRIDDQRLRLINRVAGIVLIGFGVYLLADAVTRKMAFFGS